MEETATISLKRLKELEKYEEALNEKKAVFYQNFGTYGFSRLTILSETETNKVLLNHITELNKKIYLEIDKPKKRWF
jgi:hypothetical protein